MVAFDLTHARHDRAHCLAHGLFRGLKRGGRKGRNLRVVQEFGRRQVIEYSCFEPLGADDLRVLQGLVALSAVSHEGSAPLRLEHDSPSDVGKRLWAMLEMQGEAVKSPAVAARGSFRRLAAEIGLDPDSGSSFRTIRACIERLWNVSMIVREGSKSMGFRLLSFYGSDISRRKLLVALNPRLAAVILGVNRRHTRILMSEVRALRGEVARLVHQRLCGYLDQGKSQKANMATLCSYVWPEDDTPSAGLIGKRRQRMREALRELEGLGWSVDEYARLKFEISRPKGRGYEKTARKYRRISRDSPA